MSKKKGRFNRRKYRKPQTANYHSTDRHHIFFQRRHYTGNLLKLRLFHYCIVAIPRNTLHKTIHEYIGDIPAPREKNVSLILAILCELEKGGLISNNDNIQKRLSVLINVMEDIEPRTAEALYKQLEIVNEYYSPS